MALNRSSIQRLSCMMRRRMTTSSSCPLNSDTMLKVMLKVMMSKDWPKNILTRQGKVNVTF